MDDLWVYVQGHEPMTRKKGQTSQFVLFQDLPGPQHHDTHPFGHTFAAIVWCTLYLELS